MLLLLTASLRVELKIIVIKKSHLTKEPCFTLIQCTEKPDIEFEAD